MRMSKVQYSLYILWSQVSPLRVHQHSGSALRQYTFYQHLGLPDNISSPGMARHPGHVDACGDASAHLYKMLRGFN